MNRTAIWTIAVLILIILLGWWIFAYRGQTTTADEGGEGANATSTVDGSGSTNDGERTTVEDRSSSDVASIAASISGASTFASLFTATGVAADIESGEEYTIFVPTDGAISLLAEGTITGLSAAEQRRFIEHHVIEGRALDIDAVETGVITAMSGSELNFEVSDRDEIARVNNRFAITAYRGSNGIVYVINGVLFPPEED